MLFKLAPCFSKLEFNLQESIYYKTFHSFSKIQWNYYLSQKKTHAWKLRDQNHLEFKVLKMKALTKSRVAIDPKYIPRWQTLLSTPLKHLKDLFLFVFISFFWKNQDYYYFFAPSVQFASSLCSFFCLFIIIKKNQTTMCISNRSNEIKMLLIKRMLLNKSSCLLIYNKEKIWVFIQISLYLFQKYFFNSITFSNLHFVLI